MLFGMPVLVLALYWSEPSRRLSREVGVIVRAPALVDACAARWKVL